MSKDDIQLKRSDLQFSYDDHATSGDNPKLRGHPDSDLLNRHESYEMLSFLNHFSLTYKGTDSDAKLIALKAERLIRKVSPENIHSREKMTEWLLKNWNRYGNG